ncbi:MAG: V-type ATPase subunit [Erysipelothrix sp.]|nr:V-type ATPase subunit [Erysipelothrix sp.]
MTMSFASNAMSAKAKAMYGSRLKEADYQELLHRKTVGEIAGYLKNETHYREILAGINENGIHRGYLEFLIRQSFFLRFIQLIRYGQTDKDHFYQYGIILIEIKQILLTIRSFNDSDRNTQISQMPLFASKYMSFDISKLVDVNNFSQLLDLLKPTIYYAALKGISIQTDADLDYTQCETALKNLYFYKINEIIEGEFTGKVKEQLQHIFATQMELDNINKLYRLKKYFKVPPEQIKKLMNPVSSRISPSVMEHWIDHVPADQLLTELSKSNYRQFIDKSREFIYIEYHTESIEYRLSRQMMRFASHPDIILVAYLVLMEVEVNNIVNIIEGIRYKVEPDKIAKMLIY